MKKKIASFLSFMLLLYCLAPFVYAEEAASATTPLTKPAATKPAASSPTVTSDTYLADQLSDVKGLPKDDKKKINVLLKMDAIEKASADTLGVDDNITRAQLAKTATLVLGLTIDTMVTASSFTDVQTSDPARPYIEALKKAILTYDAVDNKYNSTGPVTRQELAMLLIKGLGLDEKVKAAAPVKDETVDNAYKSYVAYALQQKIMTNQTDGKFGGNVPVTRNTLAFASYAALQMHTTTAKPAKASIAELKVIGKSKLTVRLNRDVDIDKAVLTVMKDGLLDSDGNPLPLTGGTDWSEDNTTATINLDDKFTFGTYQVELSGVDVSNGTMTFMPDTERVTKIEFVTATEKLPKSKVLIEYKATNQFGEKMELSASNVNVFVSASKKVTPTVFSGINSIGLDLSDVVYNSSITVVILEKSGYISVSKTFPVGDPPLVKKLDLGDTKNNLKLPSGQLIFRAGEKAYLTFKAYDQYGNRVVDPQYLNIGIQRSFTEAFGNVFRNEGQNDFVDFENDGYPELQLVAYPNLDSDKEVTVTFFYDGQQASQTVIVKTPKSPSAITIGPLAKPMTEGDTNVSINLKIVDSSNYELTAAEKANLLATGKITLFATGGLSLANPAIDSTGAIIVQQVMNQGPASIIIRVNGSGQTVTFQTNIGAGRRPDKITVDANGAASNVLALNGLSTKFSSSGVTTAKAQFIIYDQFGVEFKTNRDDYKIQLKLEKISGDTGAVASTSGAVNLTDANPTALKGNGDINVKSITITPSSTLTGSYKLTASIVQLDSSGQILETLSSDSVTVDVKNISTANLTYSVDVPTGDLLAMGKVFYDNQITTKLNDATSLYNSYSGLTQSVSVKVKDSSSIDSLSITPKAVISDQPTVVAVVYGNKIVGLSSGKANLNVYYEHPLGGIQKLTVQKGSNIDTLSNISDIKISGMTVPKDWNGSTVVLDGKYIWDTNLLTQVQVQTSYNTFTNRCTLVDAEFETDKITIKKPSVSCATYQDQFTSLNSLIGLQAFISDIVYSESNPKYQDSISIGPDFKVSYTRNKDRANKSTNNITKFTIYLAAGNQIRSKEVDLTVPAKK